jgi:hypothetical protein
VYLITDEDAVHCELDGVARHDACGTVLRCPAAANVVRCSRYGTTVIAGTPCGEFFVGPAGGPLPPIVPDLPHPDRGDDSA